MKTVRAQGALMGMLVGDALGARVEFFTPERVASYFPDGVREMGRSHTWATEPGQITDDGELTMALARVLRDKGFNIKEIKRAYTNWFHSDPFDCGGTIAAGISGYPMPGSKSNGSLMRCVPLGIYGANKEENTVMAMAIMESGLTHINPVPRIFTALYVLMISRMINLGWLPFTADGLIERIWDFNHLTKGTEEDLREVRSILNDMGKKPTDWTHSGYVGLAFQNALYYLRNRIPFDVAITETISMGGDTDTNAAIVGGLLGAAYGVEAIPEQWRKTVLECKPNLLPRPEEYHTNDAMDLAVEILIRG